MRPKGMENLSTFSAREVKRAAAEERERYEYSSQKDSKSQSRRQSHPSELSENGRKEDACWGDRPEREGRIEELVGGQYHSKIFVVFIEIIFCLLWPPGFIYKINS